MEVVAADMKIFKRKLKGTIGLTSISTNSSRCSGASISGSRGLEPPITMSTLRCCSQTLKNGSDSLVT